MSSCAYDICVESRYSQLSFVLSTFINSLLSLSDPMDIYLERQPLCPVPTGEITNVNVAERSRTCPNRTRSCPKRIGSVHREKPPPFNERSANVLWNETKRKKLSSAQLCCHIHGTLLPYVAILPVIGRYQLKMAASSIVSNAQLSKSYVAAIWNLLVTIF